MGGLVLKPEDEMYGRKCGACPRVCALSGARRDRDVGGSPFRADRR